MGERGPCPNGAGPSSSPTSTEMVVMTSVDALTRGSFAPSQIGPAGFDFADYATSRFADLNGDGRADVCGRRADGILCALSTGDGFTRATSWLSGTMTDRDGWSGGIELGDINADGRADICAGTPE